MCLSKYSFLDTPSLIIDYDIMMDNIDFMQKKANKYNVKLRPHTKTHKMPDIAKLQLEKGAKGITVAKVGEAEVMKDSGIDDIFIANEIVGISKLKRVRELNRKINISIGVDNKFQIDQLQQVFKNEEKPIKVLIEIEVGEERSGVITKEQLVDLVEYIKTKDRIKLKGVFSHEGHCYNVENVEKCIEESLISQRKTIKAGEIVKSLGVDIDTISIGSTPSLMHGEILPQITEIRPGTYIFMDTSQGFAIGNFNRCAATVLSTIISKPTEKRIVLDAGAKALTAQFRTKGICSTNVTNGLIKNSDGIMLSGVYDEHGLINNKDFSKKVNIGDKIEIIPNHICPVCNLYEKAYLVKEGKVIKEISILGRGKIQ